MTNIKQFPIEIYKNFRLRLRQGGVTIENLDTKELWASAAKDFEQARHWVDIHLETTGFIGALFIGKTE